MTHRSSKLKAMKTKFRHSWLEGQSERHASGKFPAGKFDLLITASSWDSRCLALTEENGVSAGTAILLLFDSRDNIGLRDQHDPKLADYCARVSKTTHTVSGSSSNIEELWERVESLVIKESLSLGRSLSILLDISTFPRFISGALLALALGRGVASKVTVFYAEGIYKGTNADLQSVFTGERWRFIPVKGLSGRYDPTKSRYFLVSIGFEGSKTLRHVSTHEPDRISILLADPGFEPGYAERSRSNNSELLSYFHVPDSQVAAAHAGDAIAAWAELTMRSLERFQEENIFYLCCGTKAHSLGMMLRALTHKSICVLYNIPDVHKVIDTRPTGFIWRYELQDVTRY